MWWKQEQAARSPDIEREVVEVRFPAQAMRLRPRTSMPFAPFTERTPGTTEPIAGDQLLRLPDERAVRAADFFREINRVEKELGAMGVSLRSPGGGETLGELAVNPAERARQTEAALRAYVEVLPGGTKLPPLPLLTGSPARREKNDTGTRRDPRRALRVAPKTTFRQFMGRKEVLAAETTAQFVADAPPGKAFYLKAEGVTTTFLSGHSAPLLAWELEMNAPASGAMEARMSVNIAGVPILSFHETTTKEWQRAESVKKTFRVPVRFSFGIGPFRVAAKAAATGEASLPFFFGLRPASAVVQAAPAVNSRLELSAQADLLVGGVSVASDVTLVDTELRLDAESAAHTEGRASAPVRRTRVVGHSSVTMLAGRATVTVFVYVPRLSIPPWRKKEFHFVLWDWQGLKTAGRALEADKTQA